MITLTNPVVITLNNPVILSESRSIANANDLLKSKDLLFACSAAKAARNSQYL
jgi:hypothetical protein